MSKSRTIVTLTNQLKFRRILETARPSAPVDALISKAYWEAWDKGAENVVIELDKSMAKDRQSHAWACKFEEFSLRENRDDA